MPPASSKFCRLVGKPSGIPGRLARIVIRISGNPRRLYRIRGKVSGAFRQLDEGSGNFSTIWEGVPKPSESFPGLRESLPQPWESMPMVRESFSKAGESVLECLVRYPKSLRQNVQEIYRGHGALLHGRCHVVGAGYARDDRIRIFGSGLTGLGSVPNTSEYRTGIRERLRGRCGNGVFGRYFCRQSIVVIGSPYIRLRRKMVLLRDQLQDHNGENNNIHNSINPNGCWCRAVLFG